MGTKLCFHYAKDVQKTGGMGTELCFHYAKNAKKYIWQAAWVPHAVLIVSHCAKSALLQVCKLTSSMGAELRLYSAKSVPKADSLGAELCLRFAKTLQMACSMDAELLSSLC